MEWVLKIPTYLAKKLEKRKDDPRKGEQCKLSYCLRPVKSVSRSATGCVSYKMATASIPPSKSHTTTLVGFCLITNIQKRIFWEITSTQSSLHITKTPQLVKRRLLECNTRVSDSPGLGWDSSPCIKNKFPGDAAAAAPLQTTY